MAPGPDKQFDPDVALDRAMRVFWAKGYAAAGMRELTVAMGINRKSLYDTFGNKRTLHIKALERYSDTIVGHLNELLNDPARPALENLRGVLRRLLRVHGAPMSSGCLIGVAMAQVQTDDREMANLLKRHMVEVERGYLNALKRAQLEGELKATTNVRDLARLITGAHQGLALMGRVSETPAVLRGMVSGLMTVLDEV